MRNRDERDGEGEGGDGKREHGHKAGVRDRQGGERGGEGGRERAFVDEREDRARAVSVDLTWFDLEFDRFGQFAGWVCFFFFVCVARPPAVSWLHVWCVVFFLSLSLFPRL